jgi:hypothetical protein
LGRGADCIVCRLILHSLAFRVYPMRVHLGRGDKILGEYEREEVEQGLRNGKFFPSDVFWMEGQEGWKDLSQFPTFSKGVGVMDSEISWERDTGTKSFFRTIVEVAFKPQQTFREGGRGAAEVGNFSFTILVFFPSARLP